MLEGVLMLFTEDMWSRAGVRMNAGLQHTTIKDGFRGQRKGKEKD